MGGMKNVTTEVNPLLSEVKKLKSVAKCGEVGTAYWQMHKHLCGTSLDALLWIALCLLVCAICAFAMLVCDVILDVRMVGVGQGAVKDQYDPNEDIPEDDMVEAMSN